MEEEKQAVRPFTSRQRADARIMAEQNGWVPVLHKLDKGGCGNTAYYTVGVWEYAWHRPDTRYRYANGDPMEAFPEGARYCGSCGADVRNSAPGSVGYAPAILAKPKMSWRPWIWCKDCGMPSEVPEQGGRVRHICQRPIQTPLTEGTPPQQMNLTMHGWDFESKPLPPAPEEGDEVEYDDRDEYLEVD